MSVQMEATFTTRKQKFSSRYRKDKIDKSYQMVVSGVLPNRARVVVDLRLYSTTSRVFACLWVRDAEGHSGSGYAGGYGYHKQSAAAAEAIYNAGIDLSESISGVGESAIERAMIAIAEAAGYPDAILVESHA